VRNIARYKGRKIVKFHRHLFAFFVILPLMLLMIVQVAVAQNEDYRFRWAASPLVDNDGISLASVVEYEIWIERDDSAEELLARVQQDTTYTLSAEPYIKQRIRVVGLSADGSRSLPSDWSDPIYFEPTRGQEVVPAVAEMKGNYPNPFNPETNLVYGIPQSVDDGSLVSLEIFTLDGRRVRTFDVDRTPGWHEVVWDGSDDGGNPAATGVYLSRLLVGTVVETKKLTMLK
jgi:hypothetical protein